MAMIEEDWSSIWLRQMNKDAISILFQLANLSQMQKKVTASGRAEIEGKESDCCFAKYECS